MQSSSDCNHSDTAAESKTSALGGSAPAPRGSAPGGRALTLSGVRHRAHAGGSTPSPSLLPAPPLIFLFLFLVLFLSGCSSAPSRLEQKLFHIRTNQLPTVTLATNIVPAYPDPTPSAGSNPPITWHTNITVTTNTLDSYTYTPSAPATQVVSVASGLGPWGHLASVIIGGLLGAYGLLRSTRSAKTAAVLAQVIETGRQVLQSTPQGQALDQQWKAWMIQHQAEQGVIPDVIKLLSKAVDEPSAKLTAQDLLSLANLDSPSASRSAAKAGLN
jgi:hypothetical protein